MPIKFRCPHCEQFLGISRSKAGEITDCPTCGRTIRVPTLDGTVAPLPSAEIDLKDANLRDALGALADLEEAAKSPTAIKAAEPSGENTKQPKAEIVDSPELRPIVVATPEKQTNPSPASGFDFNSEKALDEIAQLAAVPARNAKSTSTRRKKKSWPVLLPLTALGFLVIGFFLGRLTAPVGLQNDSPLQNVKTGINDQPAQESAIGSKEKLGPENSVGTGLQIFGKLTFVGNTGEPRADVGSRVLVLPLTRQGTAQISGAGFRIGASPVDRKILASAIQAVGGGFAISDEKGDFHVESLAPGDYQVVLASKYQSRESADLDPALLDLLSLYFDNPNKMLGRVQIGSQQLTIEPGTHIELNYEFPPG